MTDDLAARRSAQAKAQQAELDRGIIARAGHVPGRGPTIVDDPAEPTTPEQRQAVLEVCRAEMPVPSGGRVSVVSWDPSDGFANCCLAIIAVLKLGPGLMRDVAMRAGRVLTLSDRSYTTNNWGEAVRHLRGWGDLRETVVDGQTRWELGNCRPEVLAESWADPIARAVCAGRAP